MLEAVAVSVVVISPSSRSSSTPVTVMVWAVSQLAAVKVREEELREPSVVSLPVMETVTSAVGSASRTTVNVEEAPASVVSRSDPEVVPVWAMVTPGVSLSKIEAVSVMLPTVRVAVCVASGVESSVVEKVAVNELTPEGTETVLSALL